MQVSHRSRTPQEEGLLGDRVGDAHLAVLASDPRAWVVLQVECRALGCVIRTALETVRMSHE